MGEKFALHQHLQLKLAANLITHHFTLALNHFSQICCLITSTVFQYISRQVNVSNMCNDNLELIYAFPVKPFYPSYSNCSYEVIDC